MAAGLKFSVNMIGDAEVQRLLRSLPSDVARRAIKPAIRQQAKEMKRVIKAEIRQRAKRTDRLAKSVIMRVRIYRDAFLVVVGPSYWSAPHQHLVERGTKLRFRKTGRGTKRGWFKRRVVSTGRMPAMKPVSRAFKANSERIARAATRELLENLKRIAR